MSTPTVTLRSLKNIETGMDILVPGYKEEKAPLGGVSFLYEISILTSLELFKTSLHQEKDVVHFSIFKAYREIADFHNKLNKKYQSVYSLPSLPKASSADDLTSDKKVELLNAFMEEVAKNSELCTSSIFTQFIGLNTLKSSTFVTKAEKADALDASSPLQPQNEVFPKMKNVEKNTGKTGESISQNIKKADLFNQTKLSDDSKEKSKATSKSSTAKSLFDEFDDDNLFSSEPLKKKSVPQREESSKTENKKTEVSPIKKSSQIFSEADDSELIIKDRKKGDVSLFEEQDFGDYITEEEEALFLVSKPNKEIKTNSLLMAKNEILSPEKEEVADENLDELLNLSPLPATPAAESMSKVEATSITIEKDPVVPPVPLPRKKSLTKTEPDSKQKPEVMPRKVFLNKNNDLPKPSIPPKPNSGAAKPKVPPKPKPPPKATQDSKMLSKNLDAENANKTEENGNNTNSTVSSLADELKEFDILKYIEQEEKSLDSNLSLFD